MSPLSLLSPSSLAGKDVSTNIIMSTKLELITYVVDFVSRDLVHTVLSEELISEFQQSLLQIFIRKESEHDFTFHHRVLLLHFEEDHLPESILEAAYISLSSIDWYDILRCGFQNLQRQKIYLGCDFGTQHGAYIQLSY